MFGVHTDGWVVAQSSAAVEEGLTPRAGPGGAD